MTGPRAAAFVGLTLLLLAAAQPAAAVERCNGKRVEIKGKPGGEGIFGTNDADVILGGRDTIHIYGRGGHDTICGGPADNRIFGGDGSDTLLGGEGRDEFRADATDTVDGGPGSDFVFYGDEGSVGVEVNLASGVVRSMVLGDEGAAGTVTRVENVIGTDSADELRGDRRDNAINAKDGDDFVDGGRGGSDVLFGGRGDRDEVSHATSPVAVRVFEHSDNLVLISRAGTDRDRMKGFEVVTGSDFDDVFFGTDDVDRLFGAGGDDMLTGEDDNDLLFGGPGNDTFEPGEGDDRVDGEANRRVTGTKQPGDLVNYREAVLDPDQEDFAVCLDVALCEFWRHPWQADGEGHDFLTNVESVRGMENTNNSLDGDNRANVLVGGKKEDYIHGWGGGDYLFGLGFPDNLWGDAGDDFLDGGGRGELTDGGDGTDTCPEPKHPNSVSCEKAP